MYENYCEKVQKYKEYNGTWERTLNGDPTHALSLSGLANESHNRTVSETSHLRALQSHSLPGGVVVGTVSVVLSAVVLRSLQAMDTSWRWVQLCTPHPLWLHWLRWSRHESVHTTLSNQIGSLPGTCTLLSTCPTYLSNINTTRSDSKDKYHDYQRSQLMTLQLFIYTHGISNIQCSHDNAEIHSTFPCK